MRKYGHNYIEESTIKGIAGSAFLVIVQIAFILMKVFKIWKFATASIFIVLLPLELFIALLVMTIILMIVMEAH